MYVPYIHVSDGNTNVIRIILETVRPIKNKESFNITCLLHHYAEIQKAYKETNSIARNKTLIFPVVKIVSGWQQDFLILYPTKFVSC